MATAAPTFKIGDTVRLKSGGPEMTVNSVPDHYNSHYNCQWFAGKKLESGGFQPAAIELVEKE
ncbi:putative small protein [Variovorax sp. PBL-H6]|uniref:YodC family protein n=1 Tax=Variovorax sp. PBL-H6 TaxID=434009 RepID=UPI00131781DD|nr:DUF2158 domain-containing protein [Variovorax sp. PBL-H6]VTU22937.1 putative small protein [Variovorax sp. PBL-H6]